MQRKKVCFIVNPLSGKGRQSKLQQLVPKYLPDTKFDCKFWYTQAPKHATELSLKAREEKFDIVVAVGGDGTVNEVSQSLLYSEVVMAIIPAGSGNGLAGHLKIPKQFKKSLKLISNAKPSFIDTLMINDNHALNVSGIGFDAHVAHLFAKSKNRGFYNYLRIVLLECFQYKESDFTFYTHQSKVERKAYLVSIANASQYGNNACISPKSKINDGYFELCILKKPSLLAIPKFIYQLFTRRVNNSKFLETISLNEASILAPTSKVHIDGEPFHIDQKINIQNQHLSLQVLTGWGY